MGKLFTARVFVGVIGGTRNLSIELLEIATRTQSTLRLPDSGVG
jgi:hypothetical protein